LIKSSIAPDCVDGARTFRVTHPFHPLHGREFILVAFRHNWSQSRVYFYGDRGKLTSLPAEWVQINGTGLIIDKEGVAGGPSLKEPCVSSRLPGIFLYSFSGEAENAYFSAVRVS
jgi:hypothetical protein